MEWELLKLKTPLLAKSFNAWLAELSMLCFLTFNRVIIFLISTMVTALLEYLYLHFLHVVGFLLLDLYLIPISHWSLHLIWHINILNWPHRRVETFTWCHFTHHIMVVLLIYSYVSHDWHNSCVEYPWYRHERKQTNWMLRGTWVPCCIKFCILLQRGLPK